MPTQVMFAASTAIIRAPKVSFRPLRAPGGHAQGASTPIASAEDGAPRRFGTPISQVSRLIMTAVQIGTFITPGTAEPFYLANKFAELDDSGIRLLQAVGLANILSIAQVAGAEDNEWRNTSLFNAVTMLGTAAIYSAIHVKPTVVAVPFIGTLLLAGAVSIAEMLRSPRDSSASPPPRVSVQSVVLSAAAAVGTVGAVVAHRGGAYIPAVYVAQLALSSGMWAWADNRLQSPKKETRVGSIVKGSLLTGVAACAGLYTGPLGGTLAVAAVNCVARRFLRSDEAA